MFYLFPGAKSLVAFHAYGVVDLNSPGNETAVFATVMMNHGQGYDNETGAFTAPVGGLYLFSVNIEASSRYGWSYYTSVITITRDDVDLFQAGRTASFFVNMRTGQSVSVNVKISTQRVRIPANTPETYFNGALVQVT